MYRVTGWLFFGIAVGAGVWQLTQSEPYVAHAVTGLLLFSLGLLAGLRIGYDSVRKFVRNVVRINNHVLEQNNDLLELNSRLLRSAMPKAHDMTHHTPGQERCVEEPS